MHKLTAGLSGLAGLVVVNSSENALWQARARLGVAPLRWLFDLLRGPAVTAAAGGVRWCGLLVCAIDGTTMAVPDGPGNRAVYPKQAGNHGGSGYPLVCLVALVACGTRTVIDAAFGPTSRSEASTASPPPGARRYRCKTAFATHCAGPNYEPTAPKSTVTAPRTSRNNRRSGAPLLTEARTGSQRRAIAHPPCHEGVGGSRSRACCRHDDHSTP